MRMGEGMTVAKTKGRLRVRKPKLSAAQEAYQVKLHPHDVRNCRAGPGRPLDRLPSNSEHAPPRRWNAMAFGLIKDCNSSGNSIGTATR